MLNYIAVKQHITGLISLLTMLFYILITASFTSYFSFNLLAWVSLLLIVVLSYTLTLHNREDSIKNAFNAGFFLGIGSVLFPPLVYLIFIVWISILLHRENNWRAYVSSILGLSAPFVFVLTWFFLNDKLLDAILVLKEELIPQLSFPDWSVKQAVLFGILFLFGSVISLKILGSLGEKNINLRRNLLVLVTFFAFITLITLLFIKSVLAYILAAIPLALMTANFTDKSKPNKWVNWGLSVLTLVIIVFHLIGFLNAN
jgi:MFS family permease